MFLMCVWLLACLFNKIPVCVCFTVSVSVTCNHSHSIKISLCSFQLVCFSLSSATSFCSPSLPPPSPKYFLGLSNNPLWPTGPRSWRYKKSIYPFCCFTRNPVIQGFGDRGSKRGSYFLHFAGPASFFPVPAWRAWDLSRCT